MLPMFKVHTSPNAIRNVAEVFKSGIIGEGPKVAEFKQALEDRFNCNNLILLNSCTSALTLALRLGSVGPGDEVITTPFTMIATNVAIKASGATPIFADINPDNVLINFESVKKKITKKTKAIILVSVGGMSPEYEKFKKLGIPIIIDASHAIDTYYKKKHVSQWGDYVCFSFQSIKQLNTGDGGALVIRNSKKYDLGEKLKWFGMTRIVPKGKTRLEHQMTEDVKDWGYKMHMNDIQAAIGIANLEDLDMITFQQRDNAEYYQAHLGGSLPKVYAGDTPSWWAFYIFVSDRKKFMKKMAAKGIETTPMWRRNDDYSVFTNQFDNLISLRPILHNMDRLENQIVFIPVGWWITKANREYIVKSVKQSL